MNINEIVGKIVLVKILEKKGNYYLARTLDGNYEIYIEDTNDYMEEELIGIIEKCIVLEEKEGCLIGFLLTNKKFENDINKINKSLEKTDEYNKIKDIYLVKRLKINGTVSGLYLVDEGDIAKYYLNTVEIGKYIKKIRENNILFKENTIENSLAKQIKDVVQSIDLTKKEISLRDEQEKEKNLIEKALGLKNEKELTRIVTLDLKQKVYEKEEKQDRKTEQEIQNQNFIEKKHENTVKDVNIKQEMDTKDKVTDMKTLGQVLEKSGKLPNVEGKKFTKIGIIESDQRDNLQNEKGQKEKVNSTRYSFVAIANDGTVVPLDLEQDNADGNNPRKSNYQVNQKGQIKQDDVLSRYKIGEGTIAVKNGDYGEIKVYHSPRKTLGGAGVEGNKNLDRELETNNVWEIKKDERDLAGEYEDGYRSVEEGYKEASKHEVNGKVRDNDLKIDDIDGEKNTKSHVHDNVDYSNLAVKWGYYKQGTPNAEKAKEIFEQKRKENPNKETKEIVDMVTDELEEELGHDMERRY